MIRLFLRLIGIKDFETCKSCLTYKQQLDLANAEKREMIETLIQLTRPNVVVPSGEIKELTNVQNAKTTFNRRRDLLEKSHRIEKNIRENSSFIAKEARASVKDISPESVEAMEQKLGLADEGGEKINAG